MLHDIQRAIDETHPLAMPPLVRNQLHLAFPYPVQWRWSDAKHPLLALGGNVDSSLVIETHRNPRTLPLRHINPFHHKTLANLDPGDACLGARLAGLPEKSDEQGNQRQ